MLLFVTLIPYGILICKFEMLTISSENLKSYSVLFSSVKSCVAQVTEHSGMGPIWSLLAYQ
jgi:hypothetical protein